MTAKEKTDRISALIESEIKKESPAADIAERVAKAAGITVRDLSTVFTFMTGKSLIRYIKERRLNSAYEFLIENDVYSIQKTVDISGLGDQPTLIKKFKDVYGMTPKEAFGRKDFSLVTPRLSWKDFSETETDGAGEHIDGEDLRVQSMFGISYEKYSEVARFVTLRELYGVDGLQSETAYYITKTYGIPPEDAFLFVSQYRYGAAGLSAEEEDDPDLLSREEYFEQIVKKDADDPEMRYAFFNVGIESVYAIYSAIEKLHDIGEEDITVLPPELIRICAYEDMDASFCRAAVEYYLKNATEDYGAQAFEDFTDNLLSGMYIDEAFERVLPDIDINDFPDFDDDLFFSDDF